MTIQLQLEDILNKQTKSNKWENRAHPFSGRDDMLDMFATRVTN